MQNYYNGQLKKVNLSSEYPPKIKITSNDGDTNWLDLNTESAPIIAGWLITNFYHQSTPPQTKN